jgi:hypothetical protein
LISFALLIFITVSNLLLSYSLPIQTRSCELPEFNFAVGLLPDEFGMALTLNQFNVGRLLKPARVDLGFFFEGLSGNESIG